jgi:hypothetical protein
MRTPATTTALFKSGQCGAGVLEGMDRGDLGLQEPVSVQAEQRTPGIDNLGRLALAVVGPLQAHHGDVLHQKIVGADGGYATTGKADHDQPSAPAHAAQCGLRRLPAGGQQHHPRLLYTFSLSAFIADPEVEYVSAMSMALEASHMQSFQDILNTLVPIASLDPSFLQFLNPDTIGASMLRLKGLPTAWLRSEEDLAALRQAAAQAAQAQQAVQISQGVKNLGGMDEATRAARMVEANAPE